MASRQLTALNSDLTLELILLIVDEDHGLSVFGSRLKQTVVSFVVVDNVLADAAREETGFLVDSNEEGSEVMDVVVFEFDSVNQNLALVVIKTLQ